MQPKTLAIVLETLAVSSGTLLRSAPHEHVERVDDHRPKESAQIFRSPFEEFGTGAAPAMQQRPCGQSEHKVADVHSPTFRSWTLH
jgi:hypothetical protein